MEVGVSALGLDALLINTNLDHLVSWDALQLFRVSRGPDAETHATTMADLDEPRGARGCRGGGQVGTKSSGGVPDVNCGVRVHRSVVPPPTHWPQPTGGSERKKDSQRRRVKKVVSARGARTSLFRKFSP